MRLTPPRLRTVLLLSNLAVLALPVTGLWALRLYESALVRQTESELAAQAAVLASAMRAQLGIPPAAETPGAPAQPGAAALLLARRPGLDFATDPILPPQPDSTAGAPPNPAADRAGRALIPVLRDTQAITLASLRITDRAGVIVASSGGDLGQSLAAWPEVAEVLAGAPLAAGMHHREPAQTVPGGISRTSAIRVFVALPVEDATGAPIGVVVLSRTPNTLGSAIWGKRDALAGLVLVLLAGGCGLALWTSRLVTRPLAAVVEQAQAVAAGGAMAVLARPGTREVAALSAALASMAATLAQRAGYIAGFAASVSHEFKTPLAAIRAAGELLEDHDATLTPAERQDLLRKVAEGVVRLDRLVGRLVELARADMTRAGAPPIPLAPVIARVADRFRAEGLDVTTGLVEAEAPIAADALDAILSTLLQNAMVHAPGAHVRIEEAAGRLIVADDGPGIPAAHRGQVFEPFFTTARDRGGTGLGLPIVRALLAGAGGHITLLTPPRGTAFEITLNQS